MSKPSAKKQKKQKEREEENRRKTLAAEKRQLLRARKAEYEQKYPGFRFDATNGNPAFVELVKQAVAQINFEDKSIFQDWEREVYKVIRQRGWRAGSALLKRMTAEAVSRGVEGAELGEVTFDLHLGQVVFDLIGETELDRYLPFNDVTFAFRGGDVFGHFDSLLHTKGSGGTVYYSRKKPTIEVDGHKKIVAFSKHAIDRTCERIKRNRRTYAAVGDLFGFFNHCVYFERCDLHGGQLAFTFYDLCGQPPFAQYFYVEEVLGETNVDPAKGDCYYRVGYCPSIIEGDFIKAKTLLFPGFASTPEYGAILRSLLTHRQKQEMIQKTRELNADALYSSQDFGLIKWFHDNEVPQVVQLRQPVFVSA